MNLPLMSNNISREDLDILVNYLQQPDPRLTNGPKVKEFEEKWSNWLSNNSNNVKSVFVNSGASSNLISLTILKEMYGLGEIIVPPLTWVSDIASIIQTGFTPVFVDINPYTLGINSNLLEEKINDKTKAIFLTHILGINALDNKFLQILDKYPQIKLIEDVCESHGATLNKQKLGTFGIMSNFSFYYAHHASTIEGGMVCTNNPEIYEMARMIRSHGMTRESDDENTKNKYTQNYPDLHPNFIFAYPSYNMRSTEINAILGISQLKKLDYNITKRNKNLELFLNNLNPKLYRANLSTTGCSSYALILIMQEPNKYLYDNIIKTLTNNNVEFRRGLSGGGNQLRQPYLINTLGNYDLLQFPEVEHIHKYSFYIGNYPDLKESTILELCNLLNNLNIS